MVLVRHLKTIICVYINIYIYIFITIRRLGFDSRDSTNCWEDLGVPASDKFYTRSFLWSPSLSLILLEIHGDP